MGSMPKLFIYIETVKELLKDDEEFDLLDIPEPENQHVNSQSLDLNEA